MPDNKTTQIDVLFISYDGMTDPLGQSQVLPYLCGLSKRGYKITLLSCEKPERFNPFKKIIEDICIQSGVNWQPIPYTSKPPVLSTIKDIRALRKKAYRLHAEHHFKIIHCRSYISAMIGQSMQRKFKTKFLFDMRGFWADERVDGGLWNLGNPLYKTIYNYFKKKEKQYFQEADHIISLTNLGKEEILSWKNITGQPRPITVVPCCVDTTLFNPSNISSDQKAMLRRQLGLGAETLVLGYVGSIGTWYMLDEMLDCFKAFKNKYTSARMLFVTTEPKDMILKKARSLGIDDSFFIIKPAARKDVPLYISIMSYSLFFIKPVFSKKASSPTKQGEIMAMGIPVLCNAGVGDTGFVVEKYHSGITTNNFSYTEYTNAIETIANTSFSADEIREGAFDFYGLEKGIDKYESVYKLLTTS